MVARSPSGSDFSCYSPWKKPNANHGTEGRKSMDIATAAQLLSSLATLVVALGILYQGRQARKARDDQDRPQIIVDADYTGRFTTNIVVRNIGNGAAKDVSFEFSAPIQTNERAGHHRDALLRARHKLHGPANGPRRRLGLLPERGAESKGQGPDGRHHDHLEVQRPQWGVLRDRVDDQPTALGRKRVLRVQGLRRRGAGPAGPGEGPEEDF